MIKFIEIEGKHEVHGGIMDYLLKVVIKGKEDEDFKALLVNMKYFMNKEIVHVATDAFCYNEKDKTYTQNYLLTDDEKDEIEDYFFEHIAKASREKTTEEIREAFLSHLWSVLRYWQSVNDQSESEKMEGLLFSVLSTLDGSSADLPAFIVAPYPHETDKTDAIENGENYYPYNDPANVKGDIAGGLHEVFYSIGRKFGYKN